MAFWGWCCGGRLGTSAAELTREEVVDLFTLSTKVNEGRLIVHGLFARADTKNTNGRIYPKPILRREVARFKAAHVSCGSALGELNHPSYYSAYFRSLNLPNVSHQVLEVHWRGNELWGTIEVLPTPAGLLLWELYSRGIKLGVSSRGWASVVADPANNRVLVDDDFQLITFDFVTEPSNAGAYLVPIRTKYKKPLPDQLRAVRAAYLGFGSTDMANVAQLPAASVLSKWLKSTKKSMAAAAAQYSTGGAYEQAFALTAAALQQPPAAAAIGCGSDNTAPTSSYMCTSAGDSVSMLQALHPRSCVLPASTPLGGGVVLGCHYRVLQEPWLPVDPAGREFKVHLSLVATKAHIMQQKQQQRQQGKAPAAAGSRQQEEQQLPKAVVTLTPAAAAADVLNTSQSVACAPLQQQKQQQLQAASHSGLDSQQQQQLRQPPRASDDSQQQQQLHTKSSVREALCTTSTTFSLASNISLGSQHLAAAREVLLCSASTDMSGCSLGPVVPPPAGHSGASASQHARQQQQHQQLQQLLQQQQQQQRSGKARRPQSAPGLGLSSLSSLQPRSWDWDRHTQPAHAAAAQPSALQTVQVNWEQRLQAQPHSITTVAAEPAVVSSDGASLTITAASTINSTGSDTSAVGIPAAAGSLSAAAAAAAAALPADAAVGVVVSPGLGSPGKALSHSRPDSASKQLLSQGCAAAAAEDVVHDSALRGSNDNLKPTRLAAWQDAPAQQQQQQAAHAQQVQDAAAVAAAGPGGSPLRQQPGSMLDEEYQEIRDTLQRYQSEYRRQRQHLKQEAANSH